jgi:hypothetical protein
MNTFFGGYMLTEQQERLFEAITAAKFALIDARENTVRFIPESDIAVPVMTNLSQQITFLEDELEKLRVIARTQHK